MASVKIFAGCLIEIAAKCLKIHIRIWRSSHGPFSWIYACYFAFEKIVIVMFLREYVILPLSIQGIVTIIFKAISLSNRIQQNTMHQFVYSVFLCRKWQVSSEPVIHVHVISHQSCFRQLHVVQALCPCLYRVIIT